MAQSKECPKCAGSMSHGFIVDRTHGGTAVASWVEGAPKKSFWVGLKISGLPQLKITTWRCCRCFYLESYAAAE